MLRFIPFHQLLRYSFATSLKNLVYFLICCYLAQNALWEKNRTKIKKSYFVVSSIQHYYPSFYGMQMPNAFNAQACHSTTFFLFILYLPVRIKFRFIIFENKSISNLVHFSAFIETKLNKKKCASWEREAHTYTSKHANLSYEPILCVVIRPKGSRNKIKIETFYDKSP